MARSESTSKTYAVLARAAKMSELMHVPSPVQLVWMGRQFASKVMTAAMPKRLTGAMSPQRTWTCRLPLSIRFRAKRMLVFIKTRSTA